MAAAATVSVPGTTAGVGQAAAAFDDFCRRQGVPADARWRFQVALDEILSNIVRHGYRDRAGTIVLTFARQDGDVSVEVVDDAAAFDPREAPPPDTTSPLDERRPGGLGVRFAEALVGGLSYERRDGQNHLVLTWHIPAGDAEAAPGTPDGHR